MTLLEDLEAAAGYIATRSASKKALDVATRLRAHAARIVAAHRHAEGNAQIATDERRGEGEVELKLLERINNGPLK